MTALPAEPTNAEPSVLVELLVRVEAAKRPSRKLDALLEIAARKVEAYRVLPDPKHHAVWTPMHGLNGAVESQGCRYAAEAFTASLDAAMALCERVLPGWRRQINEDAPGKWYAGLLMPGFKRARLAGYGSERNMKTPALALISAMLKAKIAQAASPTERAV